MTTLKAPHLIKVYEALGAIGGGRISLQDEYHAVVRSSDESKAYDVRWTSDWSAATSNDNATHWQRQLGYPIIAAMCLSGKLPFDSWVAQQLAQVQWKQLNDQWKRDYNKVIDVVLVSLRLPPEDRARIEHEARRIHQVALQLSLAVMASS